MSHRSLKQIQEGLRRKLDEFYEVPVRDIMPGAELDPKKIAQQLRRSPGLYTGTDFSSPDLPQSAAGVASAAGRISGGGKQTGKVEPTLGVSPSAPAKPSNISKNQWKKLSADQKEALADKVSAPTARPEAPLPKKPFLQSEKKYIQNLSRDQLERYKLEQDILKANKMGLGTKATLGTAAATAAVAGIGALPDNKEKTDTATTSAVDTQPPTPVDTATTPTSADTVAAKPEPTQDNTGTQAGLPDEEPKADIETPATSVKPPPGKPYPPGTKFSDEILETYNKVLYKYKNFLNEETEQEKRYRETLEKLQLGIYGQESGSGKAKTDKPNYAGALGPMQIMPGTFKWMKDAKIIPQDFDIKNPEQNRAAGNALISHYYTKYQGDPAKVAAAYYAGPGSIRKDGTINTHWRDRKNPKAPDVGQYINQTLKKAGIADATYLASKPSGTPVAVVSTVEPVTPSPEPVVTVAKADTRPTTSAPFDSSKFDYDAFYKAVDTGQDWSDFSKFQKSSAPAKASVSERYERFKTATR